jgi:hypothetical protein
LRPKHHWKIVGSGLPSNRPSALARRNVPAVDLVLRGHSRDVSKRKPLERSNIDPYVFPTVPCFAHPHVLFSAELIL